MDENNAIDIAESGFSDFEAAFNEEDVNPFGENICFPLAEWLPDCTYDLQGRTVFAGGQLQNTPLYFFSLRFNTGKAGQYSASEVLNK